jgi:hypothetical protein
LIELLRCREVAREKGQRISKINPKGLNHMKKLSAALIAALFAGATFAATQAGAAAAPASGASAAKKEAAKKEAAKTDVKAEKKADAASAKK